MNGLPSRDCSYCRIRWALPSSETHGSRRKFWHTVNSLLACTNTNGYRPPDNFARSLSRFGKTWRYARKRRKVSGWLRENSGTHRYIVRYTTAAKASSGSRIAGWLGALPLLGAAALRGAARAGVAGRTQTRVLKSGAVIVPLLACAVLGVKGKTGRLKSPRIRIRFHIVFDRRKMTSLVGT
ncbi:hypothetical protein BJX66DRAFT_310922 [Aspergillus keveii]|uniref:Uncharacterized protein n=1 Tax=Aspergillus keveii TaxID=714993 RepID=A0ABR4FW18_9EURO